MSSKAEPTRQFGKNGPQVSRIGYGAMGLSAFYGAAKPDDERLEILNQVVANGCYHIDSSNIYGDSEVLLGKWFKQNPGLREKVFLATKFAISYNDGKPSVRGDPEFVRECIGKSIERLGTTPDLYYVHRIDQKVPIEHTMKELKKLVEEGKIKYIGLSECSAKTLERACAVHHVAAIQMEYSPWALDIESEEHKILDVARKHGVAIVAYSPVGRGMLAGKIRSQDDLKNDDYRKNDPRFSNENMPNNLKIVDKITELAKSKGCTASQLTLAWILAQGDDFFPIPGTTNINNLKENIAAVNVTLTPEDEKTIRQLADAANVKGLRYSKEMYASLFANTPEI